MTRTTALRQLLDAHGARWGSFGEAEVVADFGDAAAEYDAIRAGGLGLVDRSERETVVATGAEVVQLIQGLVTSDVYALADEGSGQRSCAVGTTGRILGDYRFLHVPDLFLIDLEPGALADGAIGHFRAAVMREDARFTDRSAATARLGLYGEPAVELLRDLGELAHDPGGRGDYDGSWGRLGGHEIIAQRLPWLGTPGFELSMAADAAADVWRAILEAAPDTRPFGNTAFEAMRVEAGIPRYFVELDAKVIPLEAGLDAHISYDKGCYMGQEIIARLDTRGTPARLLRTLVLEADRLPEPGDPVHDGDKKVGEIRSAAFSGRLERPIALAFVKRDHNAIDQALEVHSGDDRLPARVERLGYALGEPGRT